ncbi:MAG: dihydrolipoyl dehydrogenase [Alphaproteobacteria bacterium]|nr:dihydrolipoyl dehydrogenase [Alphaproteobacteria bacterium]
MQFDLIIIGAGPGGYVAAIRAAQLGMKVAVVDSRAKAGGTCLNVGCIPSKTLLHSSHKYWSANNEFDHYGITCDNVDIDLKKMIAHKDAIIDDLTSGIGFLFRKNKIEFIHGRASFKKSEEKTTVQVQPIDEGGKIAGDVKILEAPHIIIATGSKPIEIPGLPFDEKKILSSTGALTLTHAPHHLVVIGGGYIGLELGSVWRRLGSEVTVVEAMPDIVMTMDKDVRDSLKKSLMNLGISFKFHRKVFGYRQHEKKMHLQLAATNETLEKEEMMVCDAVLVAVGRTPCTDHLGLKDVGIATDERGFITVDKGFKTSCAGVYAIGDVIGGMMLAHKAEEEGIALVESLNTQAGHINYNVIPAVIFTQPEVASVGLTEEQAKEQGYTLKIGKFPMAANSLAKAISQTEGFVKIIADQKTDRVLGVHIVGAQAGAMIAEAAIAMEFSASAEDLARTCHAHPTFSEALKEAGWETFSKALHK